MEEVKTRHFHVLSLQAEHHDIILQNKDAVKDSIKSIYHDITETEIAFHSRSFVADMEEDFVDKSATNVNSLNSVMYRKERDRRGRSGGGDSGGWKGSMRPPRRHTVAHERYYKLRAEESRETRRYNHSIEIHGASAAIAYLDRKHIWEKIFHDAAEKQKKQSRRIRKLEKKDGQRGSGPFWAGANEPHLGPGTYDVFEGNIEQISDDNRVSLPVRASFKDSRNGDRSSFLGGKIDVVDDKEVSNPFSKRSAVSTMGMDGSLNKYKRPAKFDIKRGTARPRNIEEGLGPKDFLRKIKTRELKNTPKDYSMGMVPYAYNTAMQHRPMVQRRPMTSPAQRRKGQLVDDEEEEGEDLGKKIESLPDRSFASTGKMYKKWREENGIRIHSFIPQSKVGLSSAGGKSKGLAKKFLS